jgi:O-antigen/teichoic acid export membrane protein
MSTKKFFQDILLNNASQGLQFGSRWLFNITLINVLDITSYAVFSFIYSLSNILVAVLPFGSSVFLIHQAKEMDASKQKLVDAISIATLLCVVVFVVYLVLSPLLWYVKSWGLYPYGIILSYVLSLNLILFSFFKGIGDFAKELKAYSLFFILLLGFIGYLFFIPDSVKNVEFIFWVLIGINFLIFLLTFFSSKRIYKGFFDRSLWQRKKQLISAFKDRKYFGLQEVVTALYTQSGMLLLFYLLSAETYGYYRALFVIIAPLFLVTVSFSQVLLNYLKNLKANLLKRNFRKIQLYTSAVGLLLIAVPYFLKEWLFEIIKVPVNDETVLAFTIVLGAALLRFVFANYEMLLIVFDKQKYRFYIVFIVALINITLVFTLLPKYGLIGAVSTNLLTYLSLFVGLMIFSENQFKIKKGFD